MLASVFQCHVCNLAPLFHECVDVLHDIHGFFQISVEILRTFLQICKCANMQICRYAYIHIREMTHTSLAQTDAWVERVSTVMWGDRTELPLLWNVVPIQIIHHVNSAWLDFDESSPPTRAMRVSTLTQHLRHAIVSSSSIKTKNIWKTLCLGKQMPLPLVPCLLFGRCGDRHWKNQMPRIEKEARTQETRCAHNSNPKFLHLWNTKTKNRRFFGICEHSQESEHKIYQIYLFRM